MGGASIEACNKGISGRHLKLERRTTLAATAAAALALPAAAAPLIYLLLLLWDRPPGIEAPAAAAHCKA